MEREANKYFYKAEQIKVKYSNLINLIMACQPKDARCLTFKMMIARTGRQGSNMIMCGGARAGVSIMP